MMQNELITERDITIIGEEIGYELGAQMVKDFQVANPLDVQYYVIGRNIIAQILAQPGCVGIKFYNAYNELGEKTLVYVGIDKNGNALVSYKLVNNEGVLVEEKGIVADKVLPGGPSTRRGSNDEDDSSWWDFE